MSSHGAATTLNGESLGNFVFGLSVFLLVLCVLVHENQDHVQGWNPITTTYLTGIHNNINIKHREKPNKKLGGKDFVD